MSRSSGIAIATVLSASVAGVLFWLLMKPRLHLPAAVTPLSVATPPSPGNPQTAPPAVPSSSTLPPAPPAPPGAPPTRATHPAPAMAFTPPRDDPARDEADSIALDIRHFGQRFGGNPTGTNAEIVRTLTGDNPGRAKYLNGALLRLNGNGELIDRWGTPYFFHSNSATETEVRSAGPDKTLYTPDDVIGR